MKWFCRGQHRANRYRPTVAEIAENLEREQRFRWAMDELRRKWDERGYVTWTIEVGDSEPVEVPA